ncbi:MAG: hypothetical protein RIQ79_2587 [Verrucomicrobiota bacterium]|jgi:hypothetical protein
MSTLTKPRAKKPSRKVTRTAASALKPAPIKNLPAGAIKLQPRHYALEALAGADIGLDEV